MAAKNKTNEIKITRLYDAPLKAVWDAWTDPAQVGQWWGPRGFSLTTHSKDLRTGGHWNYTMHGPDGVDYPNKTTYLEVEKYQRLVYDHGANDTQPAMFRVTVNFSEVKGKTKMDMSMALPTVEAAEQTRKFIHQAGGNATWDRLAEHLDKNLQGKDKFVIARTFDTPIQTMFEMWTNPDHFSKWLAPTGFNMEFIRKDIKPGGSTFYFMSNDAGMKMYGRAEYKEIHKPDRIQYTQVFTDANEKISRHPAAPTWPETMLTTVTLAEEGPDQTRVRIEWEVYGNYTPEELDMFLKSRGGMTMGWTGSFDKLEAYLEKV
jgi:uncharacterized protein YndB with AHSA1/START domain